MNLRDFLHDPAWDAPFFKKLAHNDTAQAVGHMSGMVLPKALRPFLPELDESDTSRDTPTTDRRLQAELFLGTLQFGNGILRYQLQTWKGTRSAESRITEGFQPLRAEAAGGDLLVFQRRAAVLDRFRLILVKQGSPGFEELSDVVGDRSWGNLIPEEMPVTQEQLQTEERTLRSLARQEFQLMRPEILRVDSQQTRIARGAVFRATVRHEYNRRCAVSGVTIMTPSSLYEVESAHVVPLSIGGSDDFRNGIALTQNLHWAFDHGLFGITRDRKVYIPRLVRQMPENDYLRQMENRIIAEANTAAFRAHSSAFEWHMKNLVLRWV